MAGETILTIVGNTTAPAELRFTPSGAAVASFTVASTPRTFDRQSNEWKDGDTLFMRCSAWRDMAENTAETLDQKGMRVVVQGRLKQRDYEKDGQKRTVVELEVEEVAPSLKYASAKVTRTQKGASSATSQPGQVTNGGGGFGQPAQGGWGQLGGQQQQASGGWGNPSQTEQPPF